nr:disease resistance-like protein DSC1 [Malus domestica]
MTAHEASSSSSSKSKLWNYDVFLSFRGEDTRYGFTGHLHAALKDRGYQVFIDEDDLPGGEVIKDKLFRAIEESRISAIIFSRRYADSSWYLDELVKIMECRVELGRHVLPIFYHVDPSHVRKQDGDLAEAFQKHENDIREEKDDNKREAKQERLKLWREALTKAANLSGHHLQIANNGGEAEFIKKIIDEKIWEWLTSTYELHVTKHIVGINSRVQDIISYLSSGGSNEVLMVGIWGMGGLGKTTAAKAIYNQIHHKFEFKSFLADVRDATSIHDLVDLQKKLISDILKQTQEISCVDHGIGLIKQQFGHRKILVIVDNIDKEEQLDAIVGGYDWFGPGSRIVITTRDEHLLQNVNKKFQAKEMNEEEALELFSWHAFKNSCPDQTYLEVSIKVVSYCGEDKDYVAKMLDRCGFFGIVGINVLHERCLVTIEENKWNTGTMQNELNVHDLLREMAKVIISEKSLGHPGKWSRLWNSQEAAEVLRNKSGTEEVEGLALYLPYVWNLPSFNTEAFANMKKLIPSSQRCSAQWRIQTSSQRVNMLLKRLKILNLNHSVSLIKSPDFSQVPDLEELILEGCWSLSEIHLSIGQLQKLSLVNLINCRMLRSLPRDFYKLKSVETLLLSGCYKLREVHEDLGEMISLRILEADYTAIPSSTDTLYDLF